MYRLRVSSCVLAHALLLAACSQDAPGAGGSDKDAAVRIDVGSLGADATVTDGASSPRADGGAGGLDGASSGGADANNPGNLNLDSDCDGLSDAYEFSTVYPGGQRTDPNRADSDGDGLPDGLEASVTMAVSGSGCTAVAFDQDPTTRTSPVLEDTDGDGVLDGAEDADRNGRVDPRESDPNLRDSDGDLLPDGIEDANRDGVRDQGELDPTSRDSDGDGIGDGVEDIDRNGRVDPGETDPLSTDTDGDQLLDGDEDTNHDGLRQPYEVDPRTPDTDCDGLSDGEEIMGSTSPLVADTDGDGISDGVELGRTMPVAGSNCAGFVGDDDPSTTTDPALADTDGDGLSDGDEDADGDGRVDPTETDPALADTDGDGFIDGDELLAGTDPRDANDPDAILGAGLLAVCSNNNLQPVSFHTSTPADWTVAAAPSFAYQSATVTSSTTVVAALDDASAGIAAVVVATPLLTGPWTSVGQNAALDQRLAAAAAAAGLTLTARQSPRHVTSHDGFPAAVAGIVDVDGASMTAAALRNRFVAMSTGLAVSAFSGLPVAAGVATSEHTVMYEVLVRPAQRRVYFLFAVVGRAAFVDRTNSARLSLFDLTGGTALARKDARRGKGCDPFVTQGQAVADFIWMADISASTDDDRGRIVSAAEEVWNALANNNVDFRMGVVPHSQSRIHRPADPGHLRGDAFTTDRSTFIAHLRDATDTDGCEFGLDSVDAVIERALPRSITPTPGKLRNNATLAVVYVSDENAQTVEEGPCWNVPRQQNCPTGIGDVWTGGVNSCAVAPNTAQQTCVDTLVQPYIDRIRNEGGIAFGQVFSDTPLTACNSGHFQCPMSAQDRNEPGRGYIEVIRGTGGLFYSPCQANPGAGPLRAIVDAVTGAASQFQLRGSPIASTIKVGVTRVTGGTPRVTIVPRHQTDGFDYDPGSNSIFFRGNTHRPSRGDRVTVSYRVWQPPRPPCGPCAQNQVCDPMLGVCICDAAVCNACGPNQACDADCNCACTADCNGNCGPGQICDQATCQCECASDCGGCPSGTTCNQNSCACECDTDCGGACAGTSLSCDSGSCACVCPADCGGACGTQGVCNPSTCGCDCNPNCDSACPGRQRCDPTNACACVCPADCGGCQDGTVCDPTSCECGCPQGCEAGCQNNEICDPTNGCSCVCPADCGGCSTNERCNPQECRCVPIV